MIMASDPKLMVYRGYYDARLGGLEVGPYAVHALHGDVKALITFSRA